MPKKRTTESYQNLLMQVSAAHWKALEKANRYEKALTLACIYLTRGYVDCTEKSEYTSMQWEEFILKEVDDADECD